MEKPKRSEAQILTSVLALLKARGIFAMRMNAGDRFGFYKGKKWRIRGQPPGTADILSIPYIGTGKFRHPGFLPVWLECKREGGKQSVDQIVFQKMVETYGHQYFVVTSAEQVNRILENL